MDDVHEQIMTAIVGDDATEVKHLTARGIDLNYRCDQGASLLFGAILKGNPTIVRHLLDLGADPNLVADEPASVIYTETPLELARQARFLMDWDKYHPIVQLLVEFGATDSDGSADLRAEVEMRAREWQASKAQEVR